MSNPHAYRRVLRRGEDTTIAEYEWRHGLPLFTVWPEAELARGPKDAGWFLYCNATDEERVAMNRSDRNADGPAIGETAVFSLPETVRSLEPIAQAA